MKSIYNINHGDNRVLCALWATLVSPLRTKHVPANVKSII